METILEHIDSVCNKCGFFNTETTVNNGYGCDNEECSDGGHVKLLKDDYYAVDRCINGRIIPKLAKKMTKRNIRCNRRLAKKFLKKARAIEFDNKELKKYGFKWQGACHTFTCPLGYEADEQDILEHGEDPDSMTEGDWMVLERGWENKGRE